MRLTFQPTSPCVRQNLHEHLCRHLLVRRTFATIDDEGRHCNGSPLLKWLRIAAHGFCHERAVVSQGVRHSLEGFPDGFISHRHNIFCRDSHRLGHEERYGISPLI